MDEQMDDRPVASSVACAVECLENDVVDLTDEVTVDWMGSIAAGM